MDKFFSRINFKRILFFGFLVFLLIQFYRPNKNDSTYISENDFLKALKAPDGVKKLIKNSCYDCHSNQTNYQWFDNIAPVSWWIDTNIKNGKTALNFSNWKTFEAWRKLSYLNASVFNIETDKMPTKEYLLMNPSAKLSKEDKELLVNWIDGIDRLNITDDNDY